MKGTEKQIKWAEDIKANAIGTVDANIRRWTAEIKEDEYGEIIWGKKLEAAKQVREQLIKALDTYEDAGQLINRRSQFDPNRVLDLIDRVERQIKETK